MLKSIEIKNFRGIEDLLIEDLENINIFLGNNNCGKTSILEALFLLAGMSNPLLNITINNFRGLIHSDVDDFKYIFRNLDFSSTIKFKTNDKENIKRELEIDPILFSESRSLFQSDSQSSIVAESISDIKKINGLNFKFSLDDIKYESQVTLNSGNDVNAPSSFNQSIPDDYHEKIKATYITPGLLNLHLDKKLEKIIVGKKQKKLISSLGKIDPNITDIKLGTNGMIYFDVKGIEKLVPANIMGDGIRRVLSILTTMIDSDNGIVLIDEIENGLHFSSITTLWEAIIHFAKENNIQLFITSHNYEILKYLSEVLVKQENGINDKVVCYTIRKNEDIIKAYKYNSDEFNTAIEEGLELR